MMNPTPSHVTCALSLLLLFVGTTLTTNPNPSNGTNIAASDRPPSVGPENTEHIVEVQAEAEGEAEGGETEGDAGGEGETEGQVEGVGETEGEADGEGEGESLSAPEVESAQPKGEQVGTGMQVGGAEGENEPESEAEAPAEGEKEDGSSEPEISNVPVVCLFVTLYSLIIVIILVGNILVAVTIVKNKQLRSNVSNLYLVSLVSARASIAVFVIPARITGMFSEAYLGSILCKLCHFAALGSSSASIFSIVSIAISKYIQVTSDKPANMMTMKRSVFIIVGIWTLGFLYAIRAAIANDLILVTNYLGQTIWSCTVALEYTYLNKFFIFVDVFCLFFIPLIVILFCYSRVIRKLATSIVIAENGKKVVDGQSIRAIRMLVILVVLYTICTASPMALRIYILWGGVYFESYNIVETVIYMFSYSNSWFNLIVFAYFRNDLREAFASMCRRGPCCKRNKITTVKEIKPQDERDSNQEFAVQMMEF